MNKNFQNKDFNKTSSYHSNFSHSIFENTSFLSAKFKWSSLYQVTFKNWQWMFIVQGILTVLVGIVAYFVLVSRPDDAKWLNPEEKNLLNQPVLLKYS